ncbi:MAG: EAL domain-containing protein [Acidobacteria bacterium]|nr:EAL domain-containing protein [Acidobacteriota bacterium]
MKSLVSVFVGAAAACFPAAEAVPTSGTVTLGDPVHFLSTPSENRLDQESVYALHQDREGYLWIGTQSGLHRYNGIRYKVYHHSANQPFSLPSDYIRSLAEDDAGTLWVGTARGLAVFDSEIEDFVVVEPTGIAPADLSRETVFAIQPRGGVLWLGTSAGLFKMRRSDRFTERVFLPGETDTSTTRVYALASDQETLWVGSRDYGLLKLPLHATRAEIVPLPPVLPRGVLSPKVAVLALELLPDGDLAVGSTAGLYRIVGGGAAQVLWHAEEESLSGVAALASYNSQLWVGTLEGGLVEMDLVTGATTDYQHHTDPLLGLPGNRVRSLVIDAGGVLWVGFRQRGLRRAVIDDQRFAFFRAASKSGASLAGNDVRGIWGESDGVIWLSTIDGKFKRLILKTGELEYLPTRFEGFPAHPPTTNPRITAALVRADGLAWVGTNLGFGVFNPVTGAIRHVPLETLAGGRQPGVSSLVLDGAGQLWVGTVKSGLYRLDPRSGNSVGLHSRPEDPTTISSDRIMCLANDVSGDLLVGSDRGIDRVDLIDLTADRLIDSEDLARMESTRVAAIFQDAPDRIWLGTRRGLLGLRLDAHGRSALSAFPVGSQYASNIIQSLFGDAAGCLWSSTFNGVVQVCPETGTSRFFGEEDGLQPLGFNAAAFQDSHTQRIYFGGPDGINTFIPALSTVPDPDSQVVITGIQVGDHQLPPASAGGFEVAYDDPVIRFDVALLDFKAPRKNRFRYKLSGLHDRWQANENRREISFMNLDPGPYTLEVVGATEAGSWSSEVTTAHFFVEPPPWRTWWAVLLYLLIGTSIAGAFVVQNLRRRAERRANERALKHLAYFDTLTGLPNRLRLAERCEILLSDPGENDFLALLFIDLDRFKTINDTLGHSVGDQLLVRIAERLETCLPEDCFIARWGGDEFVILQDLRTVRTFTATVAESILELFETSFEVDDYEFSVTASIGVAFAPSHGTDLETLSRKADAALSQAKKLGRNRQVSFDEAIGRDVASRWQLETELRSALRGGLLDLAYQSLVFSDDHRLASVEVLARWTHPVLGQVPPALFIPVAEEIGMIYELEEWVLRTAALQGAAWRRQGLLDCRLCVNVSPLEFRKGDLGRRVSEILGQTGLPPGGLELEITEGVVMTDPGHAQLQIAELRDLGVSVSIDDFGTGFSSLSLLSSLGVDRLKIDRSFVARAAGSIREQGVLAGIVQIARACEIEVIAEGVETGEQEAMLKRLGCPVLQGFLFSRPLPASDFEARLRQSGR